jgi:hypothetical protein
MNSQQGCDICMHTRNHLINPNPHLPSKEKFELISQIRIITNQKIGRVRHRRINIEEATGTFYTDCIIIVITYF